MYTAIYHKVNISNISNTDIKIFSSELDNLYKATNLELKSTVYTAVLNAVNEELLGKIDPNIHHTSIQILKMLHRKYKHENILSLIINYYDQFIYNQPAVNVSRVVLIENNKSPIKIMEYKDFPCIIFGEPTSETSVVKLNFMPYNIDNLTYSYNPLH